MLNHLGIDRIHSIALDFLVDIFNEFMLEASQNAQNFCMNSNRRKLVYQDLLFLDFEVLLRWYEQRQKLKLVKSKLQMLIDDSQELNPALPYFPRILPDGTSPLSSSTGRGLVDITADGKSNNDGQKDLGIEKVNGESVNGNGIVGEKVDEIGNKDDEMVLDDGQIPQPELSKFPPIPTNADEEFCLKMQEKIPVLQQGLNQERVVIKGDELFYFAQDFKESGLKIEDIIGFVAPKRGSSSNPGVSEVAIAEKDTHEARSETANVAEKNSGYNDRNDCKEAQREPGIAVEMDPHKAQDQAIKITGDDSNLGVVDISQAPVAEEIFDEGKANGSGLAIDEDVVMSNQTENIQNDNTDMDIDASAVTPVGNHVIEQPIVEEKKTMPTMTVPNPSQPPLSIKLVIKPPISVQKPSTKMESQTHAQAVESNGNGNPPHQNETGMDVDPIVITQENTTPAATASNKEESAPQPAPRVVLRPPTRKKPDFDSLVIAASKDSKSKLDTTTPLISHSDLLTLLTFRSSGVAIPSPSSSGYETKSIISDLTLLRMPSLWWLYGGTQDLEPGGKLASELYHMPRTRKKEKKRDNGQGKAPIKTAEQKQLRKEMMEQAANRKRQMLAEADIRREVKLLAKLEKAEAKGIRLDPQTLQKKLELKAKVGNIVLPKKETKRDRMKKEKLAMEAGESSTPTPKKRLTKVEVGGPMPVISKPAPMAVGMPMALPTASAVAVQPGSPLKIKLNASPRKEPVQQPQTSNHEQVNCICSNPGVDYGLFMVCCDICNCWFHGSCVGVNQVVEHFECVRCRS